MKALRALMEGILDYAGLFPPASLSLGETVRNYAAYLGGGHAWMLGRLVCPTTKFAALDEFRAAVIEPSARRTPWRISALGRGGREASTFVTGSVDDAAAMRELADRFDGRVRADAVETRLPEDVFAADAAAALTDAVHEAADAIRQASDDAGTSMFFELPFVDDWPRAVDRAAEAVSALRSSRSEDGSTIGLKIRTGGVTAELIPSVEQVAVFIDGCARRRVPFKATAGLHHPVRHESREVGARMHGFLNVFFAAILRRHHPLSAEVLCEILTDEQVASFRFDDMGIAWGNWGADVDQIREARANLAVSFGSCSVDEPVDDLKRLGFSMEVD